MEKNIFIVKNEICEYEIAEMGGERGNISMTNVSVPKGPRQQRKLV